MTLRPANPLRVLIISNCTPCDLYLINEVARQFQICAVLRPIQGRAPGSRLNWRSFLRQPFSVSHALLNRYYMRRRALRSDAQATRELFGNSPCRLPVPYEEIPAWSINLPPGVSQISRHAPDVILVSGAPLLAPEVFTLPALGCLNIHYGISPQYRGEHTLFWPLRLGDHQHIGVTVHSIARGIDTGAPLARGYPELSAADTEDSIGVKCARLAATLCVEVLRVMQETGLRPPLESETDTPGGLLVRHRDRHIWHDLEYALRRHLLRRRPPERPERLERLYLSSLRSRESLAADNPLRAIGD